MSDDLKSARGCESLRGLQNFAYVPAAGTIRTFPVNGLHPDYAERIRGTGVSVEQVAENMKHIPPPSTQELASFLLLAPNEVIRTAANTHSPGIATRFAEWKMRPLWRKAWDRLRGRREFPG